MHVYLPQFSIHADKPIHSDTSSVRTRRLQPERSVVISPRRGSVRGGVQPNFVSRAEPSSVQVARSPTGYPGLDRGADHSRAAGQLGLPAHWRSHRTSCVVARIKRIFTSYARIVHERTRAPGRAISSSTRTTDAAARNQARSTPASLRGGPACRRLSAALSTLTPRRYYLTDVVARQRSAR